MVIIMNDKNVMMKMCRTHVYVATIIIIIQTVSVFCIFWVFRSIETDNQRYVLEIMKCIAMSIVIVACIIGDLLFINNKIILLRKLRFKTPVRCIVEDVLFDRYIDDGRSEYCPYLIVRSIEENRVFLAFRNDSLVGLNTRNCQINNKLVACTIYNWDNKIIKIGDFVDMYVLKILEVPISIDRENNLVKIKNKKVLFFHMNDKVDIHIFQNITFFRGVVD